MQNTKGIRTVITFDPMGLKSKLGTILLLSCISTIVQGQTLSPEAKDVLLKSASPICHDSVSPPDWSALLPHLKNKKYILLGEFTHGAKEIFQLRHSLIRYLHERAGVNTILFESGIGELIDTDQDKANFTARQMTAGLFGSWRTKEFEELMDYVRKEEMSIAGFDVQRTGNSFTTAVKRVVNKFGLDSLAFEGLEVRYGNAARALTARDARYDSLKEKINVLIADYRKAHDGCRGANTKAGEMELKMIQLVFENRITYLSYMLQFVKDKDWNKRWAARDAAMARNVEWLVANRYKNQPVVIVGHNFHVAKQNPNETVMGELLKMSHGKDMFVLGVFAGDGTYHDNSGKEITMLPAESTSLDIKHVIRQLSATVSFLRMPRRFTPGNEWMRQPLVVNDTFIDLANSNRMILSECYDGVLLLKRVSPPVR